MSNKWFLLGIGLFLVFVALIVWLYKNNITPSDFVQIILLAILIIVTSFYANSAYRQARDTRDLVGETRRSIFQAARDSLDVVMLQHNWKLFEHKADPGLPELPPMAGDMEYWKWRMVHLDHLNLLHTQWVYHRSVALGKEEIKALIGWAHLLLREFQNDREEALKKLRDKRPVAEPETREIMEFKETNPRLRALLDISERHNWDLFPHDFVQWLLHECDFSRLGLREKE